MDDFFAHLHTNLTAVKGTYCCSGKGVRCLYAEVNGKIEAFYSSFAKKKQKNTDIRPTLHLPFV